MKKNNLYFFYFLIILLLFIFFLPIIFPYDQKLEKVVFDIQKIVLVMVILAVIAVLIKIIIMEKERKEKIREEKKEKREKEKEEKIGFSEHQKKGCPYCNNLTYKEYYFIWKKVEENLESLKEFKALKN